MTTEGKDRPGILFLTNGYPDFAGSFRGHFIRRMAMGVRRRGYDVVVVTPRVFRASPLYDTDPSGISVHRFAYPSGNRQLIQTSKTLPAGLLVYLASGLITSLRVARKTPFQLVHVHWVIPIGLVGMALRRLLKTKLVVHAWGSDIHTYALKNPLFAGLTGSILREADALVGVSDDLVNQMQLMEPKAKNIHMISSAVDTGRFHPGDRIAARASLKLPPEARVLLFVGGLIPIKGISLLQTAMEPVIRNNPRVHLLVAGNGPLRDDLSRWAESRGCGRVRLLGSVDPEDMPGIYRAADAFVLPSSNEGTPYSLLEAMSSGLACIAFPVGGIPAIITHGDNGLLAENRNAEDLSRQIAFLMEDSDAAGRMGELARQSVQRFGEERSYDRIASLYDSLLPRAGNS
jgi:teichuronic acid biosynthesis glycosyltransferase TuaC